MSDRDKLSGKKEDPYLFLVLFISADINECWLFFAGCICGYFSPCLVLLKPPGGYFKGAMLLAFLEI